MTHAQPAAARAYTTLEVEAALCIWEELDNRSQNGEAHPGPHHWREAFGSWAFRHAAIGLVDQVEAMYDALPLEAWDGLAFDWEIVPAILDWVDWSGNRPELVLATTPQTARSLCETLRRGVGEAVAPRNPSGLSVDKT